MLRLFGYMVAPLLFICVILLVIIFPWFIVAALAGMIGAVIAIVREVKKKKKDFQKTCNQTSRNNESDEE